MPLDLEYLRRHYADLSDEGLRAIDRSGLMPAAQACYDEELARRAPWGNAERTAVTPASAPPADEEEVAAEAEPDDGAGPAWLEEAACAISFIPRHGSHAESDAANAHDVLLAAGIPCCLVTEKLEEPASGPVTHTLYKVMVPGAENLHAVSVLDRDVFNAQVEAEWKAHFEEISDEDFRALSLDDLCGGLQDRIDRLKRVYRDEVARRRSARDS